MDFSAADAYIQSPNVASLHVSGEDVHANLWSLFSDILSTNSENAVYTSEWKYAAPFKNAVESIKRENNIKTNSELLENKQLQIRICFFFIMHIHH